MLSIHFRLYANSKYTIKYLLVQTSFIHFVRRCYYLLIFIKHVEHECVFDWRPISHMMILFNFIIFNADYFFSLVVEFAISRRVANSREKNDYVNVFVVFFCGEKGFAEPETTIALALVPNASQFNCTNYPLFSPNWNTLFVGEKTTAFKTLWPTLHFFQTMHGVRVYVIRFAICTFIFQLLVFFVWKFSMIIKCEIWVKFDVLLITSKRKDFSSLYSCFLQILFFSQKNEPNRELNKLYSSRLNFQISLFKVNRKKNCSQKRKFLFAIKMENW